MKKTILGVVFMSTILALCLMLPVGASNGAAMHVSDALVDKIKEYEGFTQYPIHDSHQYSVGYGTVCNPGEYANGISEAEAEVLLRHHIEGSETYVNDYIIPRNIVLSQQQYDALVSMTYNLGPSWIKPDYQVWKLLEEGDYTDMEMVEAMAAWRKAGGVVLQGLVYRRENEAQIFFFGEYGKDNIMVRTTLDGNGGQVSQPVKLDCEGHTYENLPVPTREGYDFTGWFTAAQGGTQVTTATPVIADDTIYAQWAVQETVIAPSPEPEVPETPEVSEPTPEPEGYPDLAFTDVASDAWYYRDIQIAVKLGAVTGFDDDTYRPTKTVTYGEALKAMMVLMGYPIQSSLGGHWADGYESVAQSSGILRGITYGSLNDFATREHIAALAVNLLEAPLVQGKDVFVDTDSAVANGAYQCGIFNGVVDEAGDRWFYPETFINRAEFTKVLVAMWEANPKA